MQTVNQTYVPGTSLVHTLDPRVKLALLVMYSVCLFMVDTWWGMAVCVILFATTIAVSRLPLGILAKALIPLYFILAFTLIFNSLTFNPDAVSSYGLGGLSGGFLQTWAPVALVGDLVFIPPGMERGLFYVFRIGLLCMAGLLLSYTTEAEKLTRALDFYLKPLQIFGVKTQDLSMMLTVALRFIPLTLEELQQLRMAQKARYASFDSGSVLERVKAWGPVLVPLFVNMYRRAETLALALETRCYGLMARRTYRCALTCGAKDWSCLIVGVVLLAAVAVVM